MAGTKPIFLAALGALIVVACISLWASVGCPRTQAEPLTFAQAKSLSATELAKKLLGNSLGSKVIEAVRRDDSGSPGYAEFYTQPELTDPQLNGVCRTDVITVEYNRPETPSGSAPVKIAHVQAIPRYKAFPVPPAEPGTPENDQAQAAACAGMKTALDAFRAPSAGDAQWLTKIETEYGDESARFAFTCSDFADASCVQARRALSHLKLGPKTEAQTVDCPGEKTGDQMDMCYRLTFPYPGRDQYSDNQDERDAENYNAEWVVTVFAGMRDGMAPVRIRSLEMKHQQKRLILVDS